jgi:hypothetical protein
MFKVAKSRFDWVLTGYSWASEYWTKIKIEMVNDRSWKLHEFFLSSHLISPHNLSFYHVLCEDNHTANNFENKKYENNI